MGAFTDELNARTPEVVFFVGRESSRPCAYLLMSMGLPCRALDTPFRCAARAHDINEACRALGAILWGWHRLEHIAPR